MFLIKSCERYLLKSVELLMGSDNFKVREKHMKTGFCTIIYFFYRSLTCLCAAVEDFRLFTWDTRRQETQSSALGPAPHHLHPSRKKHYTRHEATSKPSRKHSCYS